jgi:outer membrane protein
MVAMRSTRAEIVFAAVVSAAVLASCLAGAAPAAVPRPDSTAVPRAATGYTARVLTLEQCIELAKKASFGLRAADNALSSARFAEKGFSAGRRPQIRLGGTAGASPTFGRYGYDPVITDYGQISAQVIAEQQIYGPAVSGLALKQLGLDAEGLGLARRITERDIVAAVKRVFIEIVRARGEIALERESVGQLTDYLGLVENLQRSAQVHYTDVLKTQIQLSSAGASLRKAEEASALATYELAELIGAPLEDSLEVAGSLDELSAVDRDTVAAGAAARSLESAANEIGIRRIDLETEAIRRERYPTASVIVDAGLLTSLDPAVADERWNHVGYSAALVIEMPLLDWGGRRLREQAKRLDLESARYEAAAFERAQGRELRSIALQLRNLERRIGDLRATGKDAKDNYDLTRSKYLVGAAPAIEVLAAQQLVTDTRLEELQAKAEMLTLSVRFEQILAR